MDRWAEGVAEQEGRKVIVPTILNLQLDGIFYYLSNIIMKELFAKASVHATNYPQAN